LWVYLSRSLGLCMVDGHNRGGFERSSEGICQIFSRGCESFDGSMRWEQGWLFPRGGCLR
jgi:hypothetical protein